MKLDLVPFLESMLDSAARIFALRHRQDRLAVPALPQRFAEEMAAHEAVSAAWQRANTSGVAAMHNGRLVGYLLGECKADVLRERHVWMHYAGYGIDPGYEPELYRDLYAAIGQSWLEKGYSHHFILIPAGEQARLEAWQWLGFAFEQVHALLSLDDWTPQAISLPEGLVIRRAQPRDAAVLAELAPVIRRHLAGAPVWGVALPEEEQEVRQGYAELAEDAAWVVWLAFLDGKALGMQGYHTEETGAGDPLIPDECFNLTVAATVPQARGLGIGVALTQRGLRYAQEAGYRWCSSDWRITSLLASRFWPRRGFRPVAYRMVRHVDHRVLWAS